MTIDPGRIDGLTDLRQIDPGQADAINLVLNLLDGHPFDNDAIITAQRTQSNATGWFGTDSGASFHIALADGQSVMLDASRVDSSVSALDAVDSLLDVIETGLGVILEPVSFSRDADPDTPLFQISTPEHQILLSLPIASLDIAYLIERAKAISPAATHMPCICELSIVGAYLDIDDAAGLATGDLIILATPAKAQLIWASGVSTGIVDLTTATFAPHRPDGETMSAERSGGFNVPITITLPKQTTSAASLAGLKPGSTLALAPITNGLQVTLAVAGRSFASGELVQVGDQFAVLIEQRTDMDDLIDVEPMAEDGED
jgi:Type III flagellar switch regulator (C-ring) FliN C-term